MTEAKDEFSCFGSTCAAFVIGDVPGRRARAAVAQAGSFLLEWHERFTRFEPTGAFAAQCGRARVVPVSDAMARLAEAVVVAGRRPAGCRRHAAREIEAAGYREDLGVSVPLALALGSLRRAGRRVDPREGWNAIGSTAPAARSPGRSASRSTAAAWQRVWPPTCWRPPSDA